jgi:hypothetical protein
MNKEERIMITRLLIICAFSVGLAVQTAAAAEPTEKNAVKSGPDKGFTLEDIGKGLKSAAKNIENEIPKIGPAVGETFKKVTGKESEKQSSPSPPKEKS